MMLELTETNNENNSQEYGSDDPEQDEESAAGSNTSGSVEGSSLSEDVSTPSEVEEEERTPGDSERQRERFLNMHSYLPGIPHPLCPPELIERKRKQAAIQVIEGNTSSFSNYPNNQIIELPVLQLAPGIIIFPGSTVPLRLRNPDWVRYLQRQIDRVTMWNSSSVLSASSKTCGKANIFDYNRDVVAIGVLPAKFESFSEEDHASNTMIGRIGTLALITHLSREEEERRHTEQQQQIVAMALGISRFRIIARVGVGDNNAVDRSGDNIARAGGILGANRRDHHLRRSFYGSWNATTGGGDMAEMTTYTVEVIDDFELLKPPCPSLLPRNTFLQSIASKRHRSDHQPSSNFRFVTAYLEKISPIPAFAWERVWPWKLMRLIKEQIATISAWEGLRSSNKSLFSSTANATTQPAHTLSSSSSFPNNDPSLFSFWMASNLPLSSVEQIHLLENNCIVSRLLFILNYVQHENDRPLQCGLCFKPISSIKYLFTVPGSDGTTGAYVNKHGYIHQTITVKEVFGRNVVCLGEPEIRDSWFPGYSWTMVHCSYCLNHLGWKFLPADERNTITNNATDSSSSSNDEVNLLRMRRLEGTTSNEFLNDATAIEADDSEAMEIDKEQHEGSLEPEYASTRKLRYFWGLSGSSVVSYGVDEEEQEDEENLATSEGEDNNV